MVLMVLGYQFCGAYTTIKENRIVIILSASINGVGKNDSSIIRRRILTVKIRKKLKNIDLFLFIPHPSCSNGEWSNFFIKQTTN